MSELVRDRTTFYLTWTQLRDFLTERDEAVPDHDHLEHLWSSAKEAARPTLAMNWQPAKLREFFICFTEEGNVHIAPVVPDSVPPRVAGD